MRRKMALTESGSHTVKETTLCTVQYVWPMQSHLQVTFIKGGMTAWKHVHQRIEEHERNQM